MRRTGRLGWASAAVGLGVVAGLRSQAPLAVLVAAMHRGAIDPGSGLVAGVLRSDRALAALALNAVGEIVVDKLPIAPSRLDPGPLLGRVVFGAAAGALAARTAQAPGLAGAAVGAVAAPVGALVGNRYRTAARRTGLPDAVFAVAEDAAAVGLALLAVSALRSATAD